MDGFLLGMQTTHVSASYVRSFRRPTNDKIEYIYFFRTNARHMEYGSTHTIQSNRAARGFLIYGNWSAWAAWQCELCLLWPPNDTDTRHKYRKEIMKEIGRLIERPMSTERTIANLLIALIEKTV